MKLHFNKELPNYKYISPLDFLPKRAYQSMYIESDIIERKMGDLDGYCTAWCFWFLELYINNTN